jgi:putative membrane protein
VSTGRGRQPGAGPIRVEIGDDGRRDDADMAPPFTTDTARRRLQAAADAIEARSSAEVVIAVRVAATDMRAAALLGGTACSFFGLLVSLFAPPEFSLASIAALDVAWFLVGVLAVTAMPGLARLLSAEAGLVARVRAAARSCFVELGVHTTRGRTGLLVFIALREQQIVVVSDTAIDRGRDPALARALAAIEAIPHELGLTEEALGALEHGLERLGDVLHERLPRAADDVDELGAWG